MRFAIRRSVLCGALLLTLPPAVGCQQKMADQPSYKPLDPSSFFDDGQSARPAVPGTVARGHLRTDLALFAGKSTPESRDWTRPASVVGLAGLDPLGAALTAAAEQNDYVETFPFPITREVLQHGHDRYMIYCVVCHDPLGTGRGKVVERGYTAPPSYHIPRLRDAPVGHFFDVITHGYGSMPSYGDQVPPRDRWAITAYVRALQLSQHFPEKELTDAMREELAKADKGKPEGGNGR
jgi:mono/diheme cytochrome c family protein